ncbi:MAG: glycosyltransferase family 10, partial [Deltaproteobacteria bacterium]
GYFLPKKFTAYRGIVKNKWDVLPYYRFSICYENIKDEPGYLSEKIFDSMRCGCVPIYWGASNIADYVDEGAFIDRRKFQTNEDLGRYLSDMTESEYSLFQDAICHYLNSERFKKCLAPSYADTIINTLKL